MGNRRKSLYCVFAIGVLGAQLVLVGAASSASAAPIVSGETLLGEPATLGLAPGSQLGPVLTSVGGGFTSVFYDERANGLAAVRVATDATLVDETPIPIGVSAGNANYDIASNGSEYLVAAQQSNDIFVQRFDLDFAPIGARIVVGTTLSARDAIPVVVANGSDYLVAWTTLETSGTVRVKARRVTGTGTLPDASPIDVSSAANNQTEVDVAVVGTGYVAVWTDTRSWPGSGSGTAEANYREIMAARISAAGVVEDPSGVEISTTGAGYAAPSIAVSPSNLLVTWLGSGGVVSGALVPHDLSAVGGSLTVGFGAGQTLDASFDGAHYRVAWSDFGFSSGIFMHQVRMRRLAPAGTFPEAGVLVSSTPRGPVLVDVETVGGVTLLAHERTNGSDTSIYGRRLSGATMDAASFPISMGMSSQQTPVVEWNGTHFFAVWQTCCDVATADDLMGGFFEPDGTAVGDAFVIANTTKSEGRARLAWNGTEFLVVWIEADSQNSSLLAVRVLPDGTVLDASPILIDSPQAGGLPQAAWDGTSFVVAWERFTGFSNEVYFARLGADGSILDSPPVRVGTESYVQLLGLASNGDVSLVATIVNGVTVRAAVVDGGTLGAGSVVNTTSGWSFPGSVASDGTDFLVAGGSSARRVTAAGAPAGSTANLGASVEDVAWHGTHWVALMRAGLTLTARVILPSGVVVPSASSAAYAVGSGFALSNLARGPGNRLAVASYRRHSTLGEGPWQAYLRFFDSLPTASVSSPGGFWEGDSGTTGVTFTVRMTPASNETVTLDYTTTEGTATEPEDYTLTSGSLTFAPGEISKTVVVPIVGDTVFEGNETFILSLTNVNGATPNALASSIALIANDDEQDGDGYTVGEGDADDTDPTIYPGAPELCDGKDNDQDGATDEGFADTDGDGLKDCLDADDDGDGLSDAQDPDEVAEVVSDIPLSSFDNKTHRTTIVDRLNVSEAYIAAGRTDDALAELTALRKRMDGCNGSARERPDKNDWITNCADQHVVRDLIDALIANL